LITLVRLVLKLILSICNLLLFLWRQGRNGGDFRRDDTIGRKFVSIRAEVVSNLDERFGLHGFGDLVPVLSVEAQQPHEIDLLLT